MQYVNVSVKGNVSSFSFNTNLIGLVRFCVQSDNLLFRTGYLILYTMLTVYTFKFTMIYLKRLINMAFLTLIAPIVAFTYPIAFTCILCALNSMLLANIEFLIKIR